MSPTVILTLLFLLALFGPKPINAIAAALVLVALVGVFLGWLPSDLFGIGDLHLPTIKGF